MTTTHTAGTTVGLICDTCEARVPVLYSERGASQCERCHAHAPGGKCPGCGLRLRVSTADRIAPFERELRHLSETAAICSCCWREVPA